MLVKVKGEDNFITFLYVPEFPKLYHSGPNLGVFMCFVFNHLSLLECEKFNKSL
jgi:hypothetical protein